MVPRAPVTGSSVIVPDVALPKVILPSVPLAPSVGVAVNAGDAPASISPATPVIEMFPAETCNGDESVTAVNWLLPLVPTRLADAGIEPPLTAPTVVDRLPAVFVTSPVNAGNPSAANLPFASVGVITGPTRLFEPLQYMNAISGLWPETAPTSFSVELPLTVDVVGVNVLMTVPVFRSPKAKFEV